MSTDGVQRKRIDETLRAAAESAETASECAEAAAEELEIVDERGLVARAYQLRLYEIDWPDHLTRDEFETAAEEADNMLELTRTTRLQRPDARQLLRRIGMTDAVLTGSLDPSHGSGIRELVIGGED